MRTKASRRPRLLPNGLILLIFTLLGNALLTLIAFDALYPETLLALGPQLLLNIAFSLVGAIVLWSGLFRPPLLKRLRLSGAGPGWQLGVLLTAAHSTLFGLNLNVLAQTTAGWLDQRFVNVLLTDGVTVALVMLLACIELGMLYLLRQETQHETVELPAPERFKLMRPAIFLFLFGIDLSMALLPLHMENLYQPLLGLPREVVIGLPISVEFLCVGGALLGAGIWMDRSGWQPPFYYGLALTLVGGLYSWLAPDALQFIIARGVVGIGYGLTLLAAQGFVIRQSDERSKARGLAHLFAGLYAGSICGAATGALLAERFGYACVFLMGALMVASVIAYAGWIRLARTPMPRGYVPQAPARCARNASVISFLLDRQVLAVVFLSSLPASIAVVGFLNYFSPVYLNGLGVAESTIGQILMLFGLCLTLLGPALGRLADEIGNKQWSIFMGSLLGGCAFLVFGGLQGVAATALAVVLLGISNCLVLSSQSAYVLQLPVSRRLGDGKALGIFRASSRIGQMLGPIVFAGLMLATEVRDGIVMFGATYLLGAFLFIAIVGKAPASAKEMA